MIARRMKKQDASIVAYQEEVGARLKQAVAALGIKAAEAARVMDVSPQRLNGWFSGAHPPSLYHLAAFCRAYPVTMDWLALGDARSLPLGTAVRLGLASAEN